MERVLWVLDFDNTISHRTQYEGDIELETYQDGKHHYMSRSVCEFFQNEIQNGNKVVLLTARRRELYERIHMPFQVSKAITSFGAYQYDYDAKPSPDPKPYLPAHKLPHRRGYVLEDNVFYRALERDKDGRKVYVIPDGLGKDKAIQKLKTEYPTYKIIAIGDDPIYDGVMSPFADKCFVGGYKPDLMTYLVNKKVV